jgi:hypothetical protein
MQLMLVTNRLLVAMDGVRTLMRFQTVSASCKWTQIRVIDALCGGHGIAHSGKANRSVGGWTGVSRSHEVWF